MPPALRAPYAAELRSAREAEKEGDLRCAWRHLERAHVLGQRWPREHNAVHWRMLMFGLRTKDAREVIGQLPRLVFGGVKSFVGTVPIGNTGGSNVPALKRLPIPPDLAELLTEAGA